MAATLASSRRLTLGYDVQRLRRKLNGRFTSLRGVTMAKKKATKRKTATHAPKTKVDSAAGVRSSTAARGGEAAGEFMEVGQEVVPREVAAVHLSRTTRNHRTHRPSSENTVPLRTIHRFAFLGQESTSTCANCGLRRRRYTS